MVDYVGVNVGKPLHIGHLCAPSIGQAIINSYRHRGFRVIGDIHQGDWGKSLASPPYFTHAKNGFLKLKDGAMSNREKDIVFDWHKALNSEGHSGPYIQYAFIRRKNILEKSDWKAGNQIQIPGELSQYGRDLLLILAKKEEIIDMLLHCYKPYHLAIPLPERM